MATCYWDGLILIFTLQNKLLIFVEVCTQLGQNNYNNVVARKYDEKVSRGSSSKNNFTTITRG